MWEALWAVAGVVAAGAAAWRAHRTATAVDHAAMRRLRWMFLLLAAAGLAQVAQAMMYDATLDAGGPAREGFDAFDALFWLHHACIVAALGLAAGAYVGAMAPLLLVAGPVLWLVEAAGFLGLTAWTGRNLARRASGGSLLVTLGYLMLCLATAVMVWHPPLGPRPWWVEAAWAAGLLLLWHGLPRRPVLG